MRLHTAGEIVWRQTEHFHCECVVARGQDRELRNVDYSIDATATAMAAMAQVPGLREKVEQMLRAVLETALELRRLQASQIDMLTKNDAMRLHVGDFAVWYVLDVDRRAAKVVSVVPAGQRTGSSTR
jgi:hypothetical protein